MKFLRRLLILLIRLISRPHKMATVGYTSIGANTYTAGTSSGTFNPAGLLITMPEVGDITKITAYVSMTSTTKSIACKLYSGSAGSLGSLLATTQTSAITSTPAWVDFTFATPYTASATTYWLEFVGYGGDGPGTTVANIKYDTGGATDTGYEKNDLQVPVYDTNQFSIYATYTPATTSYEWYIDMV